MIDIKEILEPYKYNDTYYVGSALESLMAKLDEYASAHPWFRIYMIQVPDTDERYFHYALVYLTESEPPQFRVLNFIKSSAVK